MNILCKNIELTPKSKANYLTLDNHQIDDIDYLFSKGLGPKETLEMYNHWYEINDKFYFKKSEYFFFELLLSELSKELKVKSTKFLLAKDEGKYCIVSENFKKINNRYVFFDQLLRILDKNILESYYNNPNLTDFNNIVSKKCINSNELMDSIYRLIAFDFFTGQGDRHTYNVIFETNLYNEVKLSPLCDNGRAFRSYSLHEYNSCFDNLYFPHEYDEYDEFSSITKPQIIVDRMQLHTLEVVKRNRELFNSLEKCLDIDMNKLIDKTIKKYKIIVTKEYRDAIVKYIDRKKNIIDLTLCCTKHI